jgi:CorA-like Mg2+ transporter protein
MLEALLRGSYKYQVDLELQRYLRDVLDHALRIVDRAGAFRSILENALTVEATLVAQRQNDEMRRMTELNLAQEKIKKISSWAAILFAPTLIGTVYGMNFDYMPELHWTLGYPFSLALMVGMGFVLYGVFKHSAGSRTSRGRVHKRSLLVLVSDELGNPVLPCDQHPRRRLVVPGGLVVSLGALQPRAFGARLRTCMALVPAMVGNSRDPVGGVVQSGCDLVHGFSFWIISRGRSRGGCLGCRCGSMPSRSG